jgi:DUF1365 family protein
MAAMTGPIALADAEIFHARLRPHGLRFRYRVLALLVDINRLEEAPGLPFFSVGGFNLLGFDPADHGPRDGSPLRDYIDRIHREAGLARPERVTLICFARLLGYVFNPIATYCCADAAGRATSVVYEVRNTFGEHHTYLFPVSGAEDAGIGAHECDKLFYVSPFMDMPLRYRFLMSPPQDGDFSLKIIERDRDGVVLTALMRARAFAPTRINVLRRLAASPLAGFKVLAGIHWQALRLWMRGHRLRPRPRPPAAVSMGEAGEYTHSNRRDQSVRHA